MFLDRSRYRADLQVPIGAGCPVGAERAVASGCTRRPRTNAVASSVKYRSIRPFQDSSQPYRVEMPVARLEIHRKQTAPDRDLAKRWWVTDDNGVATYFHRIG